jgi:hypothetical protein
MTKAELFVIRISTLIWHPGFGIRDCSAGEVEQLAAVVWPAEILNLARIASV